MNLYLDISLTYLISKKKQTLVAAFGVTFGISMFIFMNSLITGTNEYFEKMMMSSTPHIRIYHDNELSDGKMMDQYFGKESLNLIANPQMVNRENRIKDPNNITHYIQDLSDVVAVTPQVSANVLCYNGYVQSNINLSGVHILELDKMFDITSTMQAGQVKNLFSNPDGIIIGVGLAAQLNAKIGDHITLTASSGIFKTLRVVGIFKTTIKNVDESKCYVNIPVVQQLLKKDRSYITDIFINLKDYNQASSIGQLVEQMTGYQAETWQMANEQSIAARMIRDVIANAVVITILIVAGFGIYNILNMMIYEKIKEIAILKATGFGGKHVVTIFLIQSIMIGIFGGLLGVALGGFISHIASNYYIGAGNLDYLPISFYAKHYFQGIAFGLITSFFAGYIPAIKASKVDPVTILRG